MARIRDSRVGSTALLAGALAALDSPPSVFVCASAGGYYGNRGDALLDEDAGPGEGFMATNTRDWEDAATAAASDRTRVVQLRIGVVLTAAGGMLSRVLPIFRLGLGGRLGSGKQYMSWLSRADVVRSDSLDDGARRPVRPRKRKLSKPGHQRRFHSCARQGRPPPRPVHRSHDRPSRSCRAISPRS